ncbi:MAG: hypothetical protein ACUVUF_08785 [Candidatus Bathycorpusculaceae bacterium]
MGKKKLAALAVVLISALVLTVYALRVSNILEVYWSVYEPQTNLVLSFVEGYGPPSSIPRGSWQDVRIRLQNVGQATYTVRVYFKIWSGAVLPDGCIKIKYWEVLDNSWHDLPLSRVNDYAFEGWFGPSTGFPVGPGYDATSYFLVLFDANAPQASYGFQAWAEQM